MNKTELIEAVAKEANLSKKDAGAAVAAVFGEMTKALKKGDKVQMIGFGTFEVRKRAARKARNFARADEIRDQLKDMGIVLMDTKDGVKWSRK